MTTTLTPQQMRELADKQGRITAGLERAGVDATHERSMSAALRTAADQLEAVQQLALTGVSNVDDASELLDRIYALTADTAPPKASVVDVILEASRLQLAVEESADTAPQGDCDE